MRGRFKIVKVKNWPARRWPRTNLVYISFDDSCYYSVVKVLRIVQALHNSYRTSACTLLRLDCACAWQSPARLSRIQGDRYPCSRRYWQQIGFLWIQCNQAHSLRWPCSRVMG